MLISSVVHRLGDAQVVRARAPLRLGLAGGGTDVAPYCDINGGAVLNATISWYAYATIRPAPEGKVEFCANDLGQRVILDADTDMPLKGPLGLHRGVWRRLMREFNGGRPLSVCLTTAADVPAGSGLGSSSTLVVAMIEAFKELMGLPLGEYDVARLAVEIERHDLGLLGGLQDQYAATFGGVNFMEFGSGGSAIVNPLRIKSSILAEFEASLVLYFSGASRDSAEIIEDQSKALTDGQMISLEAMHELKRDAVEMKARLLRGDMRGMAEILGRSWQAKKRTSVKVSNDMIERVMSIAIANGAYAGKVSGAGGGGFMMFLVDPERKPQLVRSLSGEAGRVMTCHFTKSGAAAWRIPAAQTASSH